MKSNNFPIRMCLGCTKRKNKYEFIKIVKNEDILEIDKKFNKPGRGAYLCKNMTCLNKLYKSKRLERLFDISVDDLIYKEIGELIKNE